MADSVKTDIEMQWEQYKKAGINGMVGYGKSPAVVVVDFQNIFTKGGSDGFGADMTEAVLATRKLLDVAREQNIPIIFVVIQYEPQELDSGIFGVKVPALYSMVKGTEGVQIDERLGRREDELIITKKFQSAFAGTHLQPILTYLGVDTVIVTGCVISGCIRATVTDAMQLGFRTIIPRECVADRVKGSAEYSLFDMATKMADLKTLDEVIKYFKSLTKREKNW